MGKTSSGTSVGLLATLVALAALLVPLEAVESRSWQIEDFTVDLEVRPDSTLLVTERITVRFRGSFNGIFRTIPIDYNAPGGFNYRLFLRLEGVTDDAGRPLRTEQSREGHYRKFKIWIPGASNTTKTVVLRYRVENGLRYFSDHDELYWNVTGTEWPVPIARASARVRLPATAGTVQATAFTGPWGSTESNADITVSASEVLCATRAALGFREGLTLVVGWPKGVVSEPTPAARAWQFFRSNWVLGLPLLVFAGMFWLWYTRGRDPALDRSIAPLYAPPDGLTPAELGMLVDNSPDLRDITATLVDLAVRGFLLIEETERNVLFWSKRDYLFRLRKPRADWKDLKAHEQELLDALFAGGSEVRLSALENKFYRDLPEIREALTQELIRRGYYDHDPQKVKKLWVGIGAVIAALGLFLAPGAAVALGVSPVSAVLALILSGIVILAFGWQMPARTRKGTDTWGEVRGFEEFLARAEKDRLERLVTSPELFEKYLPYAMALGVDHNWTRAFEDIYRQPPEWYRGGNYGTGFRPSMLVRDLNALTRQASTTFVSAPRSSSRGSGFGRGGFSGGGFGGGGGGAF